MKRKIVLKVMAVSMALATVATTFAGYAYTVPVLAAEETATTVTDSSEGIELMNAGDKLVNNGVVDFGQGTASIKINGNENQSMVGKRFEIFRLFNAENSAGGESINYTWNETYKSAIQTVVATALNERDGSQLQPADITEYMAIDYIQTLNTNKVEGAQADQELEGRYSAFRYFVEDVRDAIKAANLKGDYVYVNGTATDNSISIKGLQYGYYFVDEVTEHDADGNDWYASSLIMVDTANPTSEINIKSDYPYPSIIKETKEDDAEDDGWGEVSDAEIGQTIPYKLTSTIPDMNGYQTYYYAWHDKMSDSLTFNADKSAISIVISNDDGSYTLADNEYNVITEGDALDEGDTYMIEVNDIKKIVDTHFDKSDELGHNDYTGLTVTLNYEATLNDNAAADTGAPGYSNDVRLEYSNDPDSDGNGSTGYTPWDQTKTYTFTLNANKVNNHDKVLEGAKFRLYSDADCKNEVYLKAGTSEHEYIVVNRDSTGGDDHTGGTTPAGAVEMVSGADGNFVIHGLDQGVYYLKETDAPDGYRQLLDPIVITITPTYTSSSLTALAATAHVKEFYDGAYAESDKTLNTGVEDGNVDIQVVNQVGMKLPITGSTAMILIIGAGAVCVILGAAAYRKSKKAE